MEYMSGTEFQFLLDLVICASYICASYIYPPNNVTTSQALCLRRPMVDGNQLPSPTPPPPPSPLSLTFVIICYLLVRQQECDTEGHADVPPAVCVRVIQVVL